MNSEERHSVSTTGIDPPSTYTGQLYNEGEELTSPTSKEKQISLDNHNDDHPQNTVSSFLHHKINFFTFFASFGVTTSFMPLFLQQLGMKPDQIGIVLFFRPVGGIVAGMVCPYVTDKLLSTRTALVVYSTLYLLFVFGLSLVPATPLSDSCPSTMSLLNIYGLPTKSDMAAETGNAATNIGRFHEDGYLFVSRQWMFQNDNLLYILLCICLFVFSGEYFAVSTNLILDAATLETLGQENYNSYGPIRAWGALGHGIAALATGFVISTTMVTEKICSITLSFGDYRLMFYVFACVAMVTSFNAGHLFQKSTTTNAIEKKSLTTAELKQYLFNFKDITWMAVLLCRSVFFAVTQGFLYWHMANIGASPLLLGTANLLTTCVEFFMFFTTPWMLDKFGHGKIVSVGLFSYFVRFLLFSLISNPYYILPLEILEGVTIACVWSAAMSYLSGRVPGEGLTQIQGVINTMVMMGTGIGYVLSGFITESYGDTVMFLVFAVISLATCIAFILAQAIGKQCQTPEGNET